MSTVSNSGGYIAQDPGITAADLQAIQTLSQSKDNSSTSANQAAIQELTGSKDTLASTLGSALSGQTYNYQAVHDMIWAVDHNASASSDPSGAVIDAALSTQNDTNPNIHQSDKNNLMNWAQNEIGTVSTYYNNNQNDYSQGYNSGYSNGYDNGYNNGENNGNGNNGGYGNGGNGTQSTNSTTDIFLLIEILSQESQGSSQNSQTNPLGSQTNPFDFQTNSQNNTGTTGTTGSTGSTGF